MPWNYRMILILKNFKWHIQKRTYNQILVRAHSGFTAKRLEKLQQNTNTPAISGSSIMGDFVFFTSKIYLVSTCDS